MVPMFDPMIPDTTLLVAISPALAGVVLAFVAIAALAMAGTLRERRRGQTRRPSAASTPDARAATALRAA